jgi:ABC-2 type transport system ATP-binding protein
MNVASQGPPLTLPLASAVPRIGARVAAPASVAAVEHLRKAYGRKTAVADVSLEVHAGEIFGILGPNGAGKTTTVECLAGLRTPDAGTISILGFDPRRDRAAIRARVGVQLQESSFPPRLTVREIVELFASFYPHPANPDELLVALGLIEKADTYFGRLSGGQKQRVSIALALVGNPEIAILDELTTGLDPEARRETWAEIEHIRDRGVTVLLVTHYMDEAERLCDRVALIVGGRVVAVDTPAALAEREGGGGHLRFVPSIPVSDAVLTALPSVTGVGHVGDRVDVTGCGAFVTDVIRVLSDNGAEPLELEVKSGSLEDAFVRLVERSERGSQEVQEQ